MKPSMSRHVAWERLPAFQGMATPQVRVKPRRQSLTLAENLLACACPSRAQGLTLTSSRRTVMAAFCCSSLGLAVGRGILLGAVLTVGYLCWVPDMWRKTDQWGCCRLEKDALWSSDPEPISLVPLDGGEVTDIFDEGPQWEVAAFAISGLGICFWSTTKRPRISSQHLGMATGPALDTGLRAKETGLLWAVWLLTRYHLLSPLTCCLRLCPWWHHFEVTSTLACLTESLRSTVGFLLWNLCLCCANL